MKTRGSFVVRPEGDAWVLSVLTNAFTVSHAALARNAAGHFTLSGKMLNPPCLTLAAAVNHLQRNKESLPCTLAASGVEPIAPVEEHEEMGFRPGEVPDEPQMVEGDYLYTDLPHDGAAWASGDAGTADAAAEPRLLENPQYGNVATGPE